MASLASRERLSFSKLREVLQLPDLIAVQRESFQWFLEQGVAEVLSDGHVLGRGRGRSKQAAEKDAAADALSVLEDRGGPSRD